MDAVYTYINVLIDTLKKKRNVLEQILKVSEEQKNFLQNESFQEEVFRKTLNAKEGLLKELENLDVGFEQVYERVALAIKHNKDMYKTEVLQMQELIRSIMDLSVNIQSLEEQNKNRFPMCMSEQRSQIRNFKVSNRAATNYYKNMPNIHQTGQSYFMDQKK